MKTDITEDQIRDIIKENVGREVTKIKRAKGGVVNDVFLVYTPEEELVLRISPNRWCRFESERWCFKECHNIGVPVPKVFAVGTIKLPRFNFPLTYSILERVLGEALNKLYPLQLLKYPLVTKFWNTIFPNFRKILEESGKLLAKVHSIKTKGFGWLTRPGYGMSSSWEEFVFSLIRAENFSVLIDAGLLDLKEKETITNLFRSQAGLFDLREGRLLHGDFGAENLLVRDIKITGIIDFEDAISGDPLYDLSIPALYADVLGIQDFTQNILSGYGVTPNEVFKRKIFLYQLSTAVSRMAWAYNEGLEKHVKLVWKWLRSNIREI